MKEVFLGFFLILGVSLNVVAAPLDEQEASAKRRQASHRQFDFLEVDPEHNEVVAYMDKLPQGQEDYPEGILSFALENLGSMEVLEIYGMNDGILRRALALLPQNRKFASLGSLNLEDQPFQPDLLEVFANRAPNLHTLNASIENRRPGSRGEGDNKCFYIRGFQNLEVLDLSGTEVTIVGLRFLEQSLSELQFLNVGGNLNIQFESVDLIARTWPRLKGLGLYNTSIDMNGILAIKDRLPDLKYLDVGNNTLLQNFMEILSQMPWLKKLKMGGAVVQGTGAGLSERMQERLRICLPETDIEF